MSCVALAVVAGTGLAAPSAEAGPGVYYVSASGNDHGDGTRAHPWRTVARATAAAPSGAAIMIGAGEYAPFVVSRSGQTVAAMPGERVVVRGSDRVQDVIKITGSRVTVSGLQVTGCVPDPAPPGGFGDGGSSDVRIDDGTVGVVLRNLTIRNSTGTNSYGLPFGCFGVLAHDADAFLIQDSNISGTGTGVYVNGGGQQAVIEGNGIHDNRVLIRDTPGGDDDFGANGITFANLSAVPGVVATHNDVSRNVGPSSDYGTDGGAFEIFNASHTRIAANTMVDNDVVLETGSSVGGGCVDNVFVGNQATGRTPGSGVTRSLGLLLRCASDMVIRHNTFSHLDWWVYDLDTGGRFATDVYGLAITDNTQNQTDPVYRLGVDPLGSALDVDSNTFSTTGPVLAVYDDGTQSRSLADWQRRTGLDRASTSP